MLEGSCHCGQVTWRYKAIPETATACNCGVCGRYGVLWIYGWAGEQVKLSGPTRCYTRQDMDQPEIEFLFCGTCGCVAAWRGLRPNDKGQRGMAVNLRLSEPGPVADVPIRRFDGGGSFKDLPPDGRCVTDFWP